MAISDEALLKAIQTEAEAAIGLDKSAELQSQRQIALEYYDGKMSDVDKLESRSQVQTTEVRDAIQTLLPDIMEVVMSRDNVVSFQPSSDQDIARAQQETEIVRHVMYNDNDGFHIMQTAILDGAITKLGVVTWEWEDAPTPRAEHYTGKTEEEGMLVVERYGDDVIELNENPDQPGRWDFTIRRPHGEGRVRVYVIPPEDFAVSEDTVYDLQAGTYTGFRTRVRAQELLQRGIDPEDVAELSPYDGISSDGVEQARDTVAETSEATANAGSSDFLKTVEVERHHIKLYDEEDDEIKLISVLTGNDGKTLLERDEVASRNFASWSPYLTPHRFYGKSVADVMIEVQKISTVLNRGQLDSIYFAHNQRMEIAEPGIGANTLADILDNRPGYPIRTRVAGQLAPVVAGPLNVDILSAIEHVAVMGEQRSGVVRNAQGLNPDTLHDTAKGAQILIAAANKRTRFIARCFVESLIKPLAIGIHDELRRNSSAERVFEIRRKFVTANPSTWASRNNMAVEVALGAAGRDFDIIAIRGVMETQAAALQVQGELGVTLVTPVQLYNAASRYTTVLGFKDPDMFFTDPTEQMQANAQNPPQPPPDPKMVEVQGKLELQRTEFEQRFALEVESADLKFNLELKKLQLEQLKMQLDFAMRSNQTQMEIDLKAQIAALEASLAELEIATDAETSRETANLKVQSNIGGEPG